MSKKTFLCDLSMLPSSWGDKSVSIQFFQAILNKGYDLKVICDNWNNPGQGITFDSDSGEEIVDKSGYLYDPNTHPKDFFENLVKFTFPGEYYYSKDDCNIVCDAIINWDFRDSKEWVNKDFDSIQTKFSLNPHLLNQDYKQVEDELSKTKNIVITSTWDDSMEYENIPGRIRGIFLYPEEFENMKDFIKAIDSFCLENPDHRIVLVSKKANDWDNILESNFLDLRSFEKKNLVFSQIIHLMHHQCFVTIGTESSFSIWLSMNPDAKHFIFGRFQGSEITGSRKYRLGAEKFSYSYFGFSPKLTQRTKFLIKDYLKRTKMVSLLPKSWVSFLYIHGLKEKD